MTSLPNITLKQELKTFVKVLHGSNLYGTAVLGSDTDIKSVVLFPFLDYLFHKVVSTLHTQKDGQDIEQFELYKFLRLITEGTSPCIEMLFAPEQNLLESSFDWEEIVENKDQLLNKNLFGIAQYAKVQASKYSVKGDRLLALQYMISILEKTDPLAKLLEVPPSSLTEAFAFSSHIKPTSVFITNESTKEISAIEICGRKFLFTNQIGYILECLKKIEANYGSRANMASELVQGGKGDWKACMHALRIAQQGIELATTGHITLPRPNAAYLKSVRLGEVNFNKVMEEITQELEVLDEAIRISSLPETSNINWIEDFVRDFYDL